MSEVISHGGKRETYGEFVEKFEPKKTTDDCFTPALIYEAVADYVTERYRIDRGDIVRPFWPGEDYEAYEYEPKAVVVDNPPFSLSAKIYEFYQSRGVWFFLFAPTMTVLSPRIFDREPITAIVTDVQITYANGAKVPTSFVTNMEPECLIRTAPDLDAALREADRKLENKKSLPKYAYPWNVVTASRLRALARSGIPFSVHRHEGARVAALDSQRPLHKAIFGSGVLAGDAVAARLLAAERARAIPGPSDIIQWPLSERERALIADFG